MRGKVDSGQLVTVEPYTNFYAVSCGDVVLCRVAGHQYLHLVTRIDPTAKRVEIGNNRGKINGWTTYDRIYGRVIRVDP